MSSLLLLLLLLSAALSGVASAQSDVSQEPRSASVADEANAAPDGEWIDRLRETLHAAVWRSAMHVDHWVGGASPEETYKDQATGSITPVVLWNQFNGLSQKFRFRVRAPLPYLDERYDAFIGTFNREEFVTERDQASGSIPRQGARGGIADDETLLGIRYRERERERQGGRWDADAGLRIRSPIDPFVKGGYRYDHRTGGGALVSLRQTLFWQNSEQFGTTSRIDVERMIDEVWQLRWTGSGTISERSEGVRGYTALTAYRGFSGRRAMGVQMFSAGEFDAAVPLGEYGVKAAYRQSIIRDWLVLEIRPSLTWPKDDPLERRKASWGIGVGLEMFFGVDEFLNRPATF